MKLLLIYFTFRRVFIALNPKSSTFETFSQVFISSSLFQMFKQVHSSCTVALIPPWQWLTGVCRATGKSDTRHMGVPPSCHVSLHMGPLWPRWRWQEQRGPCHRLRKRITYFHTRNPNLQEQSTNTLAVGPSPSTPPWVCQLSSTYQTSSVPGSFPFVPTPLTGDSHWGLHTGKASLSAESIHPANTDVQGSEKHKIIFIHVVLFRMK